MTSEFSSEPRYINLSKTCCSHHNRPNRSVTQAVIEETPCWILTMSGLGAP